MQFLFALTYFKSLCSTWGSAYVVCKMKLIFRSRSTFVTQGWFKKSLSQGWEGRNQGLAIRAFIFILFSTQNSLFMCLKYISLPVNYLNISMYVQLMVNVKKNLNNLNKPVFLSSDFLNKIKWKCQSKKFHVPCTMWSKTYIGFDFDLSHIL